jgi:signal transduction histidine kinase
MADVDASLKNMNAQLDHKTEEVRTLQESLADTREQARLRIAALKEQLDSGFAEVSTVDQARVEALEVELAEKSVAIETLESQLEQTRASMSELEDQLQTTNHAVDAAIIDAKEVDFHDEVIASIAQELRTPMSSIIGYTELLLRESVGILGPLQRKFLQRVKANTERMGALLDDLIRISTLDTGSIQLEPEKVDVFYAIEEVVMRIANQYAEKELSLYLTLPEALPPITTDREALTEVIQHLLINAGLASPVEGEVEIRVTAEIARIPNMSGEEISTDCLSLAVEDTGGGISPEDYERVFMRKYRADNPLIEGLGDTGVSLSLAKALVEAQGGQIWLESEQGAGTTFFVLLPLEPVSQGEQP